MIRIESAWSGLPIFPNIIVPRHSGLTLTPVVPRVRIFMVANLGVDRLACRAWPLRRRGVGQTRGRPSTRSAMIVRRICVVPPMRVYAGA